MSLHALCKLGDVYPNVEKLGMFTTWYSALHADGMEYEGMMVSVKNNTTPQVEIIYPD